ncbi:MAG: EAL domain-containing protein, partial [Sulfuricella sp.]
ERISRLAHHDALTGLFNRASLQSRLDQTLLAAQRDGKQVAVMFIDMDHFKTINDTLGHHIGDYMLIEVARRLLTIVRESDIVARLGGDEFVVVLAGIEAEFAVVTVAEKIVRVLGEPYFIDGHELHSSPSIGIGLYPNDGADGQVLMRNADTAMYHAKAQGRNNFQFFTAEMNAAATLRMKLEHDLRRALAENQLLLFYQPQVDAATGRLCGVEALVRWQHPEEGLVSPDSFIPFAEESGLILPLGEWVLDDACRQMAEWKAGGVAVPHVAVNISARQLRSHNLLEQVGTALTRHGLSPGELQLEITESTAMAEPEHAIALLRALRDLGVVLAIDDFGTGYSSLAYLKRLPIQILKLDLSFVKDIESDEDDAAICAATIALAHTLGIDVVAEGVETGAQRAFLADEHRCDMLQGYLFSRPVPAADIEKWLASQPRGL